MKKSVTALRDTQILVFIHILLTTLILYFIFTGGGCEQKEELGETETGPEITIQQIAKAYFKAIENPKQELIKANYSTIYEVNQRVELGPTLKFIDFIRTVKCILREGTTTQVAVSQETYIYDQYGNIVEKKPTIDLVLETEILDTRGLPPQEGEHCPDQQELQSKSKKNNTDPLTLKVISLLNSPQKNRYDEMVAQSIADSLKEYHKRSNDLETLSKDVIKVSLHNLKVENLSISPPTKVKQKPNCNDVVNCVFNATQIQFDIVEWYNATDYRKTRSRWVVTPQLPAFPEGMFDGFGGFISKCESGFQTIVIDDKNGNPTEQEYLITTCPEVLRNF